LISRYPHLLAGEQINRNESRKWLFITREASIPSQEGVNGRWSIDHLFIDQDGIPTLVEVKRSSDTRIHREVVGQMLDYAVNAVVYWPVDTIKNTFEKRCMLESLNPEQILAEHIGPESDSDQFWNTISQNLKPGKIRMVFVADLIPFELQRIVLKYH
jgi:hypothetical protein